VSTEPTTSITQAGMDALIKVISPVPFNPNTFVSDLADAILAAGWRPPARTVSTVEELEALPVRSVVRERDTGTLLGIETVPGVFEKFPNDLGWFCVAGHGDRTAEIEFPATVIHEGGDHA
jgi:hypothetical protein